MKTYYKQAICIVFLLTNAFAAAYSSTLKTDSLGLPGDNFDLYGALEMFKNSNSPEEFEKALNSQNNGVNNLDLNGDNQIDYIRVVDNSQGNSHSIVMQDVLSQTDVQDVGIIAMEKNGDQVTLQVIGDENLYGRNYIIEPSNQNTSNQAPPPNGNNNNYNNNNNTGGDDLYGDSYSNGNYNNGYGNNSSQVVVNVWGWPSVQYMYGPQYSPWVSPWAWGAYPGWWNPWRPMGWNAYYNRMNVYHSYYRPVRVNRVMNARRVYYPNRAYSPMVQSRNVGVHYGPRNAYMGGYNQNNISRQPAYQAPRNNNNNGGNFGGRGNMRTGGGGNFGGGGMRSGGNFGGGGMRGGGGFGGGGMRGGGGGGGRPSMGRR